jgi:curved DNA-binding protein CbpA
VYPSGFLLGACFWRRLALIVALCLVLAGGAGAIPVNPATFNKPAPSGSSTGGSCPGNYFKLTPKGGNSFLLTYYENGTAKKTFDIVSGHKGKVPTEASGDKEGSNNPIPQGVFSIGTPEAVRPSDPIGELGPTWISIDTKGYGGRSAIGFHADADGDGQSRGCVTLKNKGDIGDIANLVNGGARTIIVDHGLKENPVAGVCSPDGTSSETSSDASEDKVKSIAEIRNGLAKSCFGGPVIAFGFAVPMIFGEKLHETFAPYVSGILMIVFAIWAYLKVGSALLPFGPKDKAAALFNAIGVRFFVVLGVAVLLLAPKTGYGVYRDYIITPILSAGTTIVEKMYDIGIETNPTLAKFAKEDGACTPTPIKGLDAKLTALKDNLECKVCMIQRAYSYPWSYGLFQVGNGKIFTGLLLMLVGIAPFLMFLFTVADVFMVRIGYVSCTLSAYAAAGCFPASRKYAITGLKSLSDGAMVLVTSMIAAMLSISMLTTVIENLDKGGQADFAGTGAGSIATGTATPADTGGGVGSGVGSGSSPAGTTTAPKPPVTKPNNPAPTTPGGGATQASNFQTPTTTYATGPMGASTPNATYASWYRNTYLQQSPPKNTGFDTFGERNLSGSTLGDVPVVNPFMDNKTPTSGKGHPQNFGAWTSFRKHQDGSPRQHLGQDFDCPLNHPLRTMTEARVIFHRDGEFIYRVRNRSQDTMVTVRYLHLRVFKPIPVNTVITPATFVGYCFDVGAGGTGANAHLHLEIEICDNLSSSESLARMRAKYPASLVSGAGGIPFLPGSTFGGSTGRNCYLMHPNIFVKGAMSFTGTEAAGFSAVATNFKNFGILDVGFLLVVVMCIVSLQILKQAQRFTSGQGMGVFMKALGQMITGVIQTLGAMVGVGAKAAEMAAPVAVWAGGMAAGAAGQILQSTGLDKAVNRAAEGVQGAMNNVTQGLSGVMGNIGSGISGFVQQSVQAVQALPITQRAMEFQQGMRDLAAGIASSDFAQGIARVVMPGVAVLTFATKNIAMPVAGFVGREVLLPTAGAAVQQGAAFAFNTLTDDMFKDVNFAGELQNARENLAKAPLSEAPARDATPAVEQQAGLVRVQNTGDLTRTGERQSGPSDWEVLGVREGATLEEMRAALREKGKALHPDINPNGGEFREVTAAFERLKSRDDVQGAAPQGDTTRQLTGTTVAPMPRGETGGGRAAEDFTPQPRQSVERGYQGPDSSAFEFEGTESSASEDTGDDTPSARQDNATNRGAVKDTRAEKERERIQEAKESEAKKAAEEREKALKEKREEEEERRAQKEKQEKELRAKREKEEKEAKAKKEKEQQAELARRIEEVKDKENRAVLNRRIEELRKEELRKKEQNLTPTGPKSRK